MYEVDQNTVTLLHFEDGFKDECSTTWSVAGGSPGISTAEKRMGKSSLYLPPGAWLKSSANPEFVFGSNDFTIDFWVYGENLNEKHTGLVTSSSSSYSGIVITCDDYSGIVYPDGSDTGALTVSPKFPNNVWTHVAFVRSAGKYMFFLQGALVVQGNIKDGVIIQSDIFAIGVRYTVGDYPTKTPTYIDELRISNCARWTEGFTPGEEPEDPADEAILRVTMLDSSEREYQLPITEIDGFVNWYNRPIGTGTTAYVLNKMIPDTQEYLAFDKIISFEIRKLK